MHTETIVAMITAIAALLAGIGGIVSAVVLNRKMIALIEYRLSQVEKKLEIHNGYAKLFSEVTSDISGMRTDIEVIKTSLKFIEKEATQK